MKFLNKKGKIWFLILALSPFSAWGAISVDLPSEGGIRIDHHKRDWRYDRDDRGYRHRHGDHGGRRVCKEVTREKCKKKCHWSEHYREERCRTYCRPVTEERCWQRY